MKMEKYAVLLRYICTLGDKDFYSGHVAEKLLLDMREQSEFPKNHVKLWRPSRLQDSSDCQDSSYSAP